MFVLLRLLSRLVLAKGNAGVDDALIVFAMAVEIASNIAVSIAVTAGIGRHMTELSPESQIDAGYKLIILSSIVVWTFALPKLAILALLQRIFQIPRYILYLCWFMCFVTICGSFATSVIWFEQCRPVEHQWNPAVPGKCWPSHVIAGLGYFTSAISAVLDLAFSLYPQYLISKLNMPLEKKIGYGVALGLGALAFAISIYKISEFPATFREIETDLTYAVVHIILFAMIETDVLIITACLPTLGPLYRIVLDEVTRLRLSYKKSRYSRYSVGQKLYSERTIATIGSGPRKLRPNAQQSADDIALVEMDGVQQHWGNAVGNDSGNASYHQSNPARNHYRGPSNGIGKRVDIEQYPEKRTSGSAEVRINDLGLPIGSLG